MSKPAKGIWGFAILAALCVLVLCLGPPGQFEPVPQNATLGSTFDHPMASMPVDESVTPAVFNTGPASPPLAIAAMTVCDHYMCTEIPVALPPARAVITRRAAMRFHLVRNDGSRGIPPRRHRFYQMRVIRV